MTEAGLRRRPARGSRPERNGLHVGRCAPC